MPIFLGVDGGGTKTHALICDEMGKALGFGAAGPANWEAAGLAGMAKNIKAAVDDARREATGIAWPPEVAVVGLAGLDWPSDKELVEPVVRRLNLARRTLVVHDSPLALRAGATNPWGVALIAGTGTVAYGRSPDGIEARTLGLGPIFGDWGSGPDLTRAAVRAVARAYVGLGPATALGEHLVRLAGVTSVAALLEGLSRRRIPWPDAAPLVLRLAEEGDGVAQEIVRRAGSSLSHAVLTVARRLGMVEQPFELVLAGGVLQSGCSMLRERIIREVGAACPRMLPVVLRVPPVAGAVIMALEAYGERISGLHRENLSASLPSQRTG